MKYLSLTAAAAALLLAPATAHAQLFGGFDNSTVLGGLAGAGLGGAIGSNLAGSGNRDEGTAIGAALGGLAGTAFGNSRSNNFGNPFAGSFNPGFTGNSLLGTAVGAGIGGAIGSNLAGSGVRQEGTAIGAVLGGLAGNALTSGRSRYGNSGGFNGGSGYGGGYAPAGFNGGGFNQTGFNGGFNGGFAPANYGPAFNAPAPFITAQQFGATLPLMPMGGTSFVQGGYVDAGTFTNVMPAQAPMPIFAPAPAPNYQPLSNAFSGVTIAAPNVTLAGPSFSNSTRYGDSIGSTVTQNYAGSTGISAPLQIRRAPQSQVVVIERDHYTPRTTSVSTHSHNTGHSHNTHNAVYTPRYLAPAPAAPAGPSITAETVNINYGNNSQVGTTSSNNGSTMGGHGHRGYAPSYSAPSAPIDFGDGIGDGTWGDMSGGSAYTSSHTLGSTSVMGGYSSGSSRYSSGTPISPTVSQSYGGGESYFVGSGQSFQAPSLAEFESNCAASTFGCSDSDNSWNTAPHGGYGIQEQTSTGAYNFCGSSKVYNDDGALLLGASPVCR